MTKFIEHNGFKVCVLGDTHLGRTFINGVPLHRRGEREQLVWGDFLNSLDPEDAHYHVHMGDLFDKPIVSLGLVLRTARAYIEAAEAHPKTVFIVLQGNHDASRDLEAVSAFTVFDALVSSQQNIVVVRSPMTTLDGMAFLPWDPLCSAEEQLAALEGDNITRAFGHWDVDERSDPFNLIPAKSLAARGITEAHTGHIHLPDQFSRDGVTVDVVGSMQPYAHGEDGTGKIYKTLSLAEAREQADQLTFCCVRIDLAPGEIYDLAIDCLQLQVRKPEEVAADLDVTLGEFNLLGVFDEVASEFELPPEIAEAVRTKCLALFTSTA